MTRGNKTVLTPFPLDPHRLVLIILDHFTPAGLFFENIKQYLNPTGE